MKTKKVKMKSMDSLKPYRQHMPGQGEMDENTYYAIGMVDGKLIKTHKTMNQVGGSVVVKRVHWCDHGQEFLVVDHPNPISKSEYERTKEMYEEESEQRSMNGVC